MGIHAAAMAGNTASVRRCLDGGFLCRKTDVNAQDKGGLTALFLAAKAGHNETVKLLLARGADVGAVDTTGAPSLSWAILNGHADTATLLVEHGANVNSWCELGYPLQLALQAGDGYPDLAVMLLERGANANEPLLSPLDGGPRGVTLLHLAVRRGYKDVVKRMLERGADVNAQSESGATPLSVALHCGHATVAKLLREWGAVG